MKIQVNGDSHDVLGPMTVLELLHHLELDPARVAVELDRKIIRQKDWPVIALQAGATLEIVQFVGGG
ncbi:MAG: sulfur carrier protein ThiS [Acidobacteria bacterium]|nr:sulfur carrier protein ThiS [Acidobacteriota bacterium]